MNTYCKTFLPQGHPGKNASDVDEETSDKATTSGDSDGYSDGDVKKKQKKVLSVKCCSKIPDGHRKYDKSNACLYCRIEYKKIWRHLKQRHKDESEVAKILSFRRD